MVGYSIVEYRKVQGRYFIRQLVSLSKQTVAYDGWLVPLSPLFQSNAKWGYTHFRRVRKIAKKRLLALSCLSVRMDPLGPNWTDFHEIWYMSIFRKSVEKIEVSWKSDKNGGYTWRSWIRASWYNYESNQKVAMIQVNLLFLVSSTCFGPCFRPSSGALDCSYSIW